MDRCIILVALLAILTSGCKIRQDRSAVLDLEQVDATFESCSAGISRYLFSAEISCSGLSGKCRAMFLPAKLKQEDDPEKFETVVCQSAKASAMGIMQAVACGGKPDSNGKVVSAKFTTNMEFCPLNADAAKTGGWEEDAASPVTYHPGASICYRKTSGDPVLPGVSPANQCCYGPSSEDDLRKGLFTLITLGKGAGTPDIASTVGNYNKFRFGLSHLSSDVCTFELLNGDVMKYHALGWGPHHAPDAPANSGGLNMETGQLHGWFSIKAAEKPAKAHGVTE